MLSAFFTRITNLFRGTAGGLPQQNPNMVADRLQKADDMRAEQASRSEYIYVCTNRERIAFEIGTRHGYPPSKVYIVSSSMAVHGLKGVTCIMAMGWSDIVRRSGGEILSHMRANGWELVDEQGAVIRPTWDGCHVRI